MSKAVLVLNEMPTECFKCKLYQFAILGKGFEQGWNVCINEITGKTEGKND